MITYIQFIEAKANAFEHEESSYLVNVKSCRSKKVLCVYKTTQGSTFIPKSNQTKTKVENHDRVFDVNKEKGCTAIVFYAF